MGRLVVENVISPAVCAGPSVLSKCLAEFKLADAHCYDPMKSAGFANSSLPWAWSISASVSVLWGSAVAMAPDLSVLHESNVMTQLLQPKLPRLHSPCRNVPCDSACSAQSLTVILSLKEALSVLLRLT